MLGEIILSVLAEASFGFGAKKAKQLLERKNAPEELSSLCEAAIESAIRIVPALAEDLRSKSFVKGALVPMVEATIENPAHLPDPQGLSEQYINMFVARFAMDEAADETMSRIFQTDRDLLRPAFEAFFKELKAGLYKSEQWREIAHYGATEAVLADTRSIKRILERNDDESARSKIDLVAAAKDAATGSAELRNWPKEIFGQHIDRPEIQRMLAHMEAESSGTSLLIGEAGSGKSALLAELTERLENDGVTVFAIKADTLPPDVKSTADIGLALGMDGALDMEVTALARDRRVVVIVDQLDAVSDVMDRSSARMRLLLRLVRQIQDQKLGVHIVVSSRPFEAAHDARFHQLGAEEFKLDLPSTEKVIALLTALSIDTAHIDLALQETLRRPFALKLFAELARRGAEIANLSSSQLLDRWLATANLGSEQERRSSISMMQTLAEEMIATESLWRPLDRYEAEYRDPLARCEACGLLVRSGNKLGFSHQAWLDDFQAKGFTTGSDLAEYAWRNQGSLFVRAAVLRGLQRLRAYDQPAYLAAVDALLGDAKTRRHLRHLVVDMVSANSAPIEREAAWIETLVGSDKILANRGLGQVVAHWEVWRPLLAQVLPSLMPDEQFRWRAVQLLAAEAKFDPDNVTSLISLYWDTPEFDGHVFRVLEQSGLITPDVEKRIAVILERTGVDPYSISHFATTLRAEQRFADAARIVATWAATLEIGHHSGPQLHDVQKLAEEAPVEFARAMLPWFISRARSEVDEMPYVRMRFPRSRSLPWDWNFNREHDNLFEALRISMTVAAVGTPAEAYAMIVDLLPVEIEQVQELIAETLTAGAASLAESALEFLFSDERRLCLGDAHVTFEPGLSGTVTGLVTHELVGAIAPHLTDDALIALRDKIEVWSLYGAEAYAGDDAKLKRHRLGWADDHRLELLERLPATIIPARRRRQIKEWRARNRKPIGKSNVLCMATFVGSPMSEVAMAKASDSAILKMLDEVCDASPERSRRRRISMDGGVIELSRAFAAFGKEHPDRAIGIAKAHLKAGVHEHAAGALVSELAAVDDVAPEIILDLVFELSAKGFNSKSWCHDAAWALSKLSGRMNGLSDQALSLLEGWLRCDEDVIAMQIERRLEFEERNRTNEKKNEPKQPEAVLFNRFGGMRILPHDNFTILSAMAHGLLSRPEPDCDGWLAVLERHAPRAEDPAIWTALIGFEGRWLFWADRDRVHQLIGALWRRDPSILDGVDMIGLSWSTRAMFPKDVLRAMLLHWLTSDDPRQQQGAAEFIAVANIVSPDDALFVELAMLRSDDPSPTLNGWLFAAAAAWREDDLTLRSTAHPLLMRFAATAAGDQAHAISTAVDYHAKLKADKFTKELIPVVSANSELLEASLNGRFADGLQGLLLYPGFDELVLEVTEKIADLILKNMGQRRGLIDQDFVHVAVALQRSDGPMRERAMDVYERLLDAGAYGAEEAAKAAAGR